ncbi:PREDICTED: uncharacterized protein LOC106323890 [Brassica oleracea var. oleracea]|uniref:uncharacterized protein LOC106323890 n=1 Tax=Brassica oleracea var. oleracea TaxID=109376 RepID=UPI0006A6EAC1|nr:PREDICTED: uncharacterized protein LOC106323890 [Brassica oleracea var. oleracea]
MEIDLCTVTEGPSPIFGLSGDATMTLGLIDLVVKAGSIIKVTEFLVIDRPTSYNAIVGTPWLNSMRAIPSTFHLCLKFPTPRGVETIQGDRRMSQATTPNSDIVPESIALPADSPTPETVADPTEAPMAEVTGTIPSSE